MGVSNKPGKLQLQGGGGTAFMRQASADAPATHVVPVTTLDSFAAHEEEVALLSAKLRQLLEERAGLQALVDSQAADLQLMSAEVVRLVG